MTKYLVLIPDGSADQPQEKLGGLTPLQAAYTPNFDRLAKDGLVGSARTIPAGFAAGSDVANLCVMGYDPHLYYTGRAPLEAASLGISLNKNDIAFRCNLVFVEDGKMRDFSAGHISSEEAAELIGFLQKQLGSYDAIFFPGLSYRHIMVSHGRALAAKCTPPHDITGETFSGHLPQGEGADWLNELMMESARLLANHNINKNRIDQGKNPANMIWLWGQGTAPQMPAFSERFNLTGSVISAVDLVKGLGKFVGLRVVDVPGATGWLDTDYKAKAKYALQELKERDFVYVHVEAPDEASHAGDLQAKIKAIEQFDSDLVGEILDGLSEEPHFKILVMPDHATPLSTRTHSDLSVPCIIFDSLKKVSRHDLAFDEPSASRSDLKFENGWEVMNWFIKKART